MSCDVCVIGGGPAGSTAAHRLARLGYDVCLVERKPFPRQRIGESLPPGILPMLEALGVRDRVDDAAFLRPTAALVRWAEHEVQRHVHPGPPGYQVERARFDKLLLDAACEAGVRVIQPAHAWRRDPRPGSGWSVDLRQNGSNAQLSARFIVDASGRRGWSWGRRLRASAPTLALFGYWRGTSIAGPETRVEAGEDAWTWCAPLADGTVAAAVFIDARQTAVGSISLTELYGSLLSRFELTRGCLDGVATSPVAACDASCVHVADPVGEAAIVIGDAGLAMDPLSSQGVQAAIGSGLQAAAGVNTMLARPADEAVAARFLRDRLKEKLFRHREASAAFYTEMREFSDTPFWRSRAASERHESAKSGQQPVTESPPVNCRIELSPATQLLDVPSIDGDYIRALPGVSHPGLDRPLTFLDGIAIRPLLDLIGPDITVCELVQAWSRFLPSHVAWRAVDWMWAHSIILDADREV